MVSALPLRPSIDHTPRPSTSFDLAEEDSSIVLESLASETARAILSALGEGPATASDIADRVDTSRQNAYYHITNLKEAGIVTCAGTWYSSKGREMPVYDITSEEIQLQIGATTPDRSAEAPEAPTGASPLSL